MNDFWGEFTHLPEQICTCAWCKNEFLSHARFVTRPKTMIISRKQCPNCGETQLTKAETGPEVTQIINDHYRKEKK